MLLPLGPRAGLAALEAVATQVPHLHLGAGTVTRAAEMQQVPDAGARFALSPGMSDALVQAAMDCRMPFMPGVMTPSEVMQARDHGFGLMKLFPAAPAGGLALLKPIAGPFGALPLYTSEPADHPHPL